MPVDVTRLVAGGATVKIAAADIGAIKDGVTVTPTLEILTVDLEQELTPSKGWPMARRWTIDFTMCEPTLENIKYAWDVVKGITAGPPRLLEVGEAAAYADTILAARVILLSSIVPGGVTVRSLTFSNCILETPAPIVFSKRQEVNLKQTYTALYDYATAPDRVGQFSDA